MIDRQRRIICVSFEVLTFTLICEPHETQQQPGFQAFLIGRLFEGYLAYKDMEVVGIKVNQKMVCLCVRRGCSQCC